MQDCKIGTIAGPIMAVGNTRKVGRLFAKTDASEIILWPAFNDGDAICSAMKGLNVLLSVALLMLAGQLTTFIPSL